MGRPNKGTGSNGPKSDVNGKGSDNKEKKTYSK